MNSAANSLWSRYLLLGTVILVAGLFQTMVAVQTFSSWKALPDPIGELRNGTWPVLFILQILTPLICLCFAVYVTAVRIEDRRAWLLLAVLVTFSITVTGADVHDSVMEWESPVKHLVLVYRSIGVRSWAIWLMVFAIYFPERATFDVKRPGLKWLFIVPCIILCIVSVVERVGRNEGGRWEAAVQGLRPFNSLISNFLAWIPIVFFLGVLIAKARYAEGYDSRRRLRVLLAGLGFSVLPPVAFSTLIHSVLHVPERAFGGWVQFFAYVPLAFLPVVLGYVVIVEKAFDVRVVIRQGLRYALAKRGLSVVQVVISAVVVVGIALTSQGIGFVGRLAITAAGVGLLLVIGLGGRHLAQWLDRRFFRDAYRAEQLLTGLAERVRSMVELRPLFQNVLETISQALHVRDLGIFLRERGTLEPALVLGDGSWKETEGIVVPIPGRSETLGQFSLGPRLAEAPYSESDRDLLKLVASQTAFAIENSQLTAKVAAETAEREVMQRELDIARDVQQRLFPQACPNVAGLDYAASCRPAREVGGDYYDYFELQGGGLGIAMGDVSGKGVPASLLMAGLQASLRGQTGSGTLAIEQVITNVNRMVWSTSPANKYATFFYAEYQPEEKSLIYVNAGHNPPFLFRQGQEVIQLEAGGPPVGLFETAEYQSARIEVRSGDLVVLYTDGMTEAMNSADEEWGEDNMRAVVSNCRHDPKQILSCLFEGADAFAGGAPQHDDMTAMVCAFRS